jgi:EAL domain-containing protein (putative c-di-GMP-specific phosphodiesterase class I)
LETPNLETRLYRRGKHTNDSFPAFDLFGQFDDILKRADIRIVFQPIISLRDGEVLGYEALSPRPQRNAV